jgi:hypothetical protein
VATFSDANPNARAADFGAFINWGDGSPPTAGVVVANGTTFSVLGNHTYSDNGFDTIQVDISENAGTKASATTSAGVGDPPLLFGNAALVATVNTPFSGVLFSFSDSGGFDIATEYSAQINWGDQSPSTTGSVTLVGSSYVVSGSHTYRQAGTFPLSVVIGDGGALGDLSTAVGTATVVTQGVSQPLFGRLDPSFDSGASASDNITNVNKPQFTGKSDAFAVIRLFAQRSGEGGAVLIGQGVADASGAWRIIPTGLFADGSYTITVTATDPDGTVKGPFTLLPLGGKGPLVIDTVGPRVVGVRFDPPHVHRHAARRHHHGHGGKDTAGTPPTGQVDITFQDDRSGLDQTRLLDPVNYTLIRVGGPPGERFVVTRVTTTASTDPSAPQQVALTINHGQSLPAGTYLLKIASGGVDGVTDVAGNALDGEYYGSFPSGNGRPGGNFAARIDFNGSGAALEPLQESAKRART